MAGRKKAPAPAPEETNATPSARDIWPHIAAHSEEHDTGVAHCLSDAATCRQAAVTLWRQRPGA